MATPTRELIEIRLTGRSLTAFVAVRRRQGMGWRSLAQEVTNESGVPVSFATLRRWFPDPSNQRPAA